ncbi:MAG: class II aldolase/adducin family protein [Ignavibacteriae bacterium]|nr:class II aldolase/adducin family protein [Ignavibacteriota bacterium]
MDLSRADIARQLVWVSHKLYERGLVTATDGNVSARLANGNIFSTPAFLNKGRVAESDLVEVKLDGTPVTLDRKVSTEVGMHLFIYRQRADVQAVVHAHPTYATGFATARVPLSDRLFPEVIVGIGTIPLADYATPSTQEVADSLAPYVQTATAILLTNHGAVTYGTTLDEAYFKMEKLEHAAHIQFVAHMLGGEKPLTNEELEKLHAISKSSYGKEISPNVGSGTKSQAEPSDSELKALIKEILKKK